SQSQEDKDLFLYPNADLAGCTDFTAVGDSPNYACVDDPILEHDEDDTYVTWSQITEGFDLYELPNHGNDSGTINYVQVYARAKSHETAQSSSGIYKIICSPDGTCTDVYDSDDFNLITGYRTYNNIWTTNPSNLSDWEWSDIDLLCIGEKCDSPTVTPTRTLTLRPNNVGLRAECTPHNCTVNWMCVDEAIADEDGTYNSSISNGGEYDIFNIEDPPGGLGTISSVTVYVRGKGVPNVTLDAHMKFYIRTG
ncbi:unnamed protein product, partial [marine sediment metagenome]